ncbi:MAG: phage virion morphogenesis protein [Novosphingobium sp. 28-62-57]|uniref:phage virion morphogenesis protein n=1 Tax=unclassified Novosphingobium TaxID=2644732 RepID=UPI000BD19227|nr:MULTISPECIES: phage virion morphogenesis protein [unclassified Novosphingobium]OYW47336.1 MAG: phage virion morphogenesis protein [Novosphingobium sp. 12-63-9]OYZ08004.1 MAG: phage virion morphogenesis protein [Novosphingobium sp. 28-62-57]
MADDDLSRLDDWMGQVLQGISPPARKKAATKLGRELRQANAKRIGQNTEPDGSPMEGRKPRLDRRGRVRANGGRNRMFQGLRELKHWRIDADETGVNVTSVNAVIDRLASVNQYGETAPVGRHPVTREMIRYRYPERRLLGFAPDDEKLTLDIAAKMIEPD